MARGKRWLLVSQAALVWMDEDFDRDAFIESGRTGNAEVMPFNPAIRAAMCAAYEGKLDG